MARLLQHLRLLGCLLHALTEGTVGTSEFQLDGDYLIGGLFDVHHVNESHHHNRLEAITCSHEPLILSSYRRFQLMRFAIEEINNSTSLLPNVSLGYEIFDHCSDTHNIPNILNLMSDNDRIQPWSESHKNLGNLIAVVGTYTSTETRTVAPFFMMDHVPMISYGAASSFFSRKQKFPSFLRTLHPNQDVIKMVVKILQYFSWRWVSFLYVDDDYGNDGRYLFLKEINDTDICLAYSKGLDKNTDYPKILNQINSLGVNVIIVFVAEWTAEKLIPSAIAQNFSNKVWIAGDAWSLHKKLPKEEGIENIGTVLGVAERIVSVPGFSDFLHSFKTKTWNDDVKQTFCNQNCYCSSVTAESIITADPSFSFSVYSAVYAVAHALHDVLQCGAGRCDTSITVHPQMVLKELHRSNFTLLNQTIDFDENGDPMFGSYSMVFWNHSGGIEVVGSCHFRPSFNISINSTKIKWHGNGTMPTSLCTPECQQGHKKKQEGAHKCCFNCTICEEGTYINVTEDAYNCKRCNKTEWSLRGSTTCKPRLVEYIPLTDSSAIAIMFGTLVLVGIAVAVSVLFAINYNTPVVRSAGGPMCFLILGCLTLSSLSVFFYFGKPTVTSCVLRFLPFLLFFNVCQACFVVRSFQIVTIFKVAAQFPNLISGWRRYHGQWLFIIVAFVTQAVILIIGYEVESSTLQRKMLFPSKIILGCKIHHVATSCFVILPLSLVIFGFIFSYMGKSLPKNYSEAKAITFCFFLLLLIWIIFVTTYELYKGKYIDAINALAILSSLYSFLLSYFLPKCYIIVFQPYKNTHQYFQDVIQDYNKRCSW